jgi:hypothetical protein
MEAAPSSTSSAVALASTGMVPAATCDPTKDIYCDLLDGDNAKVTQTAAQKKAQLEAAEYYTNPLDLLPAWRWGTAVSTLDQTYGTGDAINLNTTMDGFARILFALAGLLWVLLLGLSRLAMMLSPLASDSVGKVVNTAFSSVGAGVSRGLIWVPIVGALLFALIGPIRSKGAASTSSLILLLALPLGMMWGMMTAVDVNSTRTARTDASGNVVKDSNGDTLYDTETVSGIGVGSPVWLARTGTGMIDELSSFVVSGIGDAFIKERLSPLTSRDGSATTPSCSQYVTGLYDSFEVSWNKSTMGKTDSGVMRTFSDLWMSTIGTNWVRAQFGGGQYRGVPEPSIVEGLPGPKGISTGSTAYGWRIWCHMLENNRDTAVGAQARIGVAGGYPYSVVADRPVWARTTDACFDESQQADESGGAAAAQTACASEIYGGYLGSSEWSSTGGLDSTQDRQQQMMNWAACNYSPNEAGNANGWVLDKAWDEAATNGVKKKNEYCNFWWNSITPSNWTNNEQEFQWTDDGENIPCTSDATCNIKTMYRAMHGKNAGERLFAGISSIIGSVLYFWLLAMLLVGVVVSKIGLMLMLILLPFTLFLLALPKWRVDPKRAQRNATGLKLLKQTFAFATSTAVLQLIVSFLLVTIGLLRSILSPLNIYGLSDLAAPIIAYFVFTKLMKILGLGNIALGSPMGAMSLPLAAAAGMGGFGLGSGGKTGMAAAKAAAGKGAGAPKAAMGAYDKARAFPGDVKSGKKDANGHAAGGAMGKLLRKMGYGGGGDDAAIEKLEGKVAAAANKVNSAKTPEDRAKAMDGLIAAQSALDGANDIKAANEAHKNKQALDAATADGRKAELMAAMATAESAVLAAGGTTSEAQAAALEAFSAKAAEHRGLDRANELGAQLSALSSGAISSADAAEAIASGSMAGYVTLGNGTSMSIGSAVAGGFAQLDPSGGGAMLTAKGIAAGGSMVGMVNMPGGSSMSMADAVTNGLVSFDAASGAVAITAAGTAAGLTAGMLPSASMVVAGGAGGPDASALETQTVAHDAVMGSAAGARATANGTAAALGIGAGGVSPLRGNTGIIAPAHGSATGFGSMQDLGNLKGAALLNSTAATSLLLGSDVADQLWAACGGDEETYAAACDNALSMAGIRGMSMGDALANSGWDAPKQRHFLNQMNSGNAASVEGALSEVRSLNGGQGLYGVSSSGINAAVASAFVQTSSARQGDVGAIQGGVIAMSSDATNAIGEAAEILQGYSVGSGAWHDYNSGSPAQKSAAEKTIVAKMVNAELAVMRVQHAHQAAEQLAATGFIAPDNTSWSDERTRLVDHYTDHLQAGNWVTSDTSWLRDSISSMQDHVRDAQVMPTVRTSRPAGVPSSRGVATTPGP